MIYTFKGEAHRTEGVNMPEPFTREVSGETQDEAVATLKAEMLAEGYYVRSIDAAPQ